MSQNVWKNIKFILDNVELLNMRSEDLKQMKKMIYFFKLQVKQQIITDAVQGNNEETTKKIEEAKEYIERSKKEIEEEIKKNREEQQRRIEIGEYEPKKLEIDVSGMLQDRVEEKRKEQYEFQKGLKEKLFEKKRRRLEKKEAFLSSRKEELERLEKCVQDPKAFIKTILDEELKSDGRSYKDLINICAIAMSRTNDIMEVTRGNEEEPLFIRRNGDYIPNPEAIKNFIEFIRDEELLKELNEYYILKADIYRNNARIESKNSIIADAQDVLNAVNDEKVSGKVEEYISTIHGLAREYFELSQKRASKSYLPVASNSVIRAFNTTFRSDKVRESEEVDENFNLINAIIKKEYDKHMEEMSKDSKYAEVYTAYRRINARNEAVSGTVRVGRMSAKEGKELHQLYLLKERELSKGESLKDCVKRPIEKHIGDLEESVKKDKKSVMYSKTRLEELYTTLTPEAKSYIENGGRSTVDINTRYKLEEVGRNGVSPYIASLILEALMDEKGIHTIEDAEKMGIAISEEDMKIANERAEKINKKIIGDAKLILNAAEAIATETIGDGDFEL